MNRAAIFHRTYSEYSFAIAANRVVIRLRSAKGELRDCRLFFGDRMDPHDPIRMTQLQMERRYSDSLFDYFEVEFDPQVTRLCYYFWLSDGKESVYYSNDSFFETPPLDRHLYYNFHYIREEDIPEVPEWAKSAIVYQIYPDSFATRRRFISGESRNIEVSAGVFSSSKFGGTLRGIYENIDYLAWLGINCIYLTPIFKAESWHKYDTIDYMDIDPCFGTKEDLRKLVEVCHENNIRVILDGVFNHCGFNFFAFRDLYDKGEKSKYRDWFYPKGFPLTTSPLPNYECFAYVASMPKLNTGNPEVAEYLINVGEYWVREFDIDGWRLDVANEIDHKFWRRFRQAIRAIKPDALLIAEIWDDARAFLNGDQFDSAMNYNLYYAITDFFALNRVTPKEFSERIQYLLVRYRRQIQQVQLNLIDSHDVPRFLSQANGDKRKLKLAALFLFTHVGIPMIFYGDEKGMEGWKEIDYRKPMIWDDREDQLLDYYRKLVELRKTNMDAMLGDYVTLLADDEVYAYLRRGCSNSILVAMNVSPNETERTIELPAKSLVPEGGFQDILTGFSYPVSKDKRKIHLHLEPYSAAIINILHEQNFLIG